MFVALNILLDNDNCFNSMTLVFVKKSISNSVNSFALLLGIGKTRKPSGLFNLLAVAAISNIIDANLTGIELRLTLPINRDGVCC